MVIDINNTENKYYIIYADPPWHYNTWRDGMGTAEKHYKTMKVEEIVNMKDTIKNISEKDCLIVMHNTILSCLFWIYPCTGAPVKL